MQDEVCTSRVFVAFPDAGALAPAMVEVVEMTWSTGFRSPALFSALDFDYSAQIHLFDAGANCDHGESLLG